MSRVVVLPPPGEPPADGVKSAGWWHTSQDGRRLVCDLCPRGCALRPGARGFCFVRQNRDGHQIVLTTYGRSTGFCIDPIEKKPLNHFYPGTAVLSFGTAGCNLGCKFCQNWSISKSREVERLSERADPDTVAEAARQLGCRSVAFTYNDPIIWAEYAIDAARACHAVGVKTVAVTSGYITPLAREPFFEVMDAANVDLKGFSEDFYWRLASGHLEPVLDTLEWLVRHTDVWVEVTNLVIPGENDSPGELRRMCDWIVRQLGPDVPVHFTAFHPDFRLRDRPRTPPERLAQAYDIARQAGIRYPYTGNLSDRSRQTTYCAACGRVLIERDGYHLGVYGLAGSRCGHCGEPLPGRFGSGLGDWGARRMPVRISAYASARPQPSSCEQKGVGTMDPEKSRSGEPEQIGPQRPDLSPDQEQVIFRTAGRRVAAAVGAQPAERVDQALGTAGTAPVLGAFVSLKRAGQLRSCCGFLGHAMPLYQALDHAAVRAATDDPRFPPISPTELEHLDMEVWILWGLQRVTARGRDRVGVVQIGRHGLQVIRGNYRGLLLPGVAVDHHFDSEEFLEQVCRKAGLPPAAWMEDDVALYTFEGYAIRGKLASCLPEDDPPPASTGPGQADLAQLAEFSRQNLAALLYGATPSLHLPGAYDGSINGLVLTVHLSQGGEPIQTGRVSVRPDMPLQATLFDVCKGAARTLGARRIGPGTVEQIRVGLTIMWDPAMHGSTGQPELEGLDPARRAVVVLDRGRWAVVFDPGKTPEELVEAARGKLRLAAGAQAAVCSMETASTESRIELSNVPPPQKGSAVRPPAVAGRFYPAAAAEIDRMLAPWLASETEAEPWTGAMVPHAGWIYSGRLAADVLRRIRMPDQVIIVAPKHTPGGADWAVAPHQAWSLPGASVESDPELAAHLAERVNGLELDAAAHAHEHAIEVQLPILARLAPETRAVGIVMLGGDLAALRRFGRELAAALADLPTRPLLVISSDMNHYADDQQTRRLDRLALDALKTLDSEKLFKTVRKHRISMCGLVPAVAVLETLKHLDALHRCHEVGYTTSAEASGDTSHVVGYAGMLFA